MMEQKNALPTEDQQTLECERRRVPRYPSDLETTCKPLVSRDGSSWLAQIRDISTLGIGLVLQRRFERGTLLVMDLENPARNISRNVVARVVHTTALPLGQWLLGCVFTKELDADDLQFFSAESVLPSDPEDSRAWVRFSCDVSVICRQVSRGPARPLPGKIVNIAPGGAGLVLSRSVNVGTLLNVELTARPGQTRRTYLVRVVKPARQDGANWFLGCEFTNPFSDEELRTLLYEKNS
jgi:hypothetical protein